MHMNSGTNATIAKNNEYFMKMMDNDSDYDDEPTEHEIKEKAKKNIAMKKMKIAKDKELKTRSADDQKKIDNIMEHFFISWLITREFLECKDDCESNDVIFYDKQTNADSETFSIITIQMYYFHQNYEREKTIIINHITNGNTLFYLAKKRDGTYLNGMIDYTFNKKNKIIKIEVDIDTTDNTDNKFKNIPLKTYNYRPEEKIEVSPLPIWDRDRFLEHKKGTLYTLMYKLYRAWIIYQDVDEINKLMANDAKIHDKVLNKEFFNDKDVSIYLLTFIAHHLTSGIYVRQYKILNNELIIRIHWPEKKEWTDILVYARIKNNLFIELSLKKAYFDAFKDPNDATVDIIKKMEKSKFTEFTEFPEFSKFSEYSKISEINKSIKTSDENLLLTGKAIN